MIRRLKNHPYAQCEVIIDMDTKVIQFISYSTLVIVCFPKGSRLNEFDIYVPNGHDITDCDYMLYCSGTYSHTTRRQISWFLREYFPELSYQDMKTISEYGNTVIPGKLEKSI